MFEVQQVMDRAKVADCIHAMLDLTTNLSRKTHLTQDDHAKLKVLRTGSSAVSSAVLMIQQETAQQRNAIVVERMRQLGYSVEPPASIASQEAK